MNYSQRIRFVVFFTCFGSMSLILALLSTGCTESGDSTKVTNYDCAVEINGQAYYAKLDQTTPMQPVTQLTPMIEPSVGESSSEESSDVNTANNFYPGDLTISGDICSEWGSSSEYNSESTN